VTAINCRRELPHSPYLSAATGQAPNRMPVWFMRQAGCSLLEYRALRFTQRMEPRLLSPELVCEITLQPVRRYGVDAAILFSDIRIPLRAAGIAVDSAPGAGQAIQHPIRSAADLTQSNLLTYNSFSRYRKQFQFSCGNWEKSR
jgi:uroporphyrinogen decarboxylase